MKGDLERLQGSWAVTALEVDGQFTPAGMLAEARIVIRGRRFTSSGMGAVYRGTVALDDSHTPAHIDMTFTAGPEKGNTNLGIYRFSGETLTLCLATRGSLRPERFAALPGSGFALETLSRAAAPLSRAAAPTVETFTPARSPATEFEGEWRMVSGIVDGRPMEKSAVQWVRRVSVGNQTTVYAGPQTIMQFEFTHDPASSPQTIDYLNQGKPQLGIYSFDDDLLTVHVAPPGSARPSGFTVKPGETSTLTVWKRASSRKRG
jgi:uncharacterized protein (TIGR03067 family)